MRALYAFSGDPITYGHIDIVERAARTYDEVLVAIGENPAKSGRYLFTSQERLIMARDCLKHLPNVDVKVFSGLLGEYAFRHGFDVIIRGVRNNSDLEGELVLYNVVESLHNDLEMVFYPTRRHLSHISSGVVKAIVNEGGDVSAYCPLRVKEELERRILGRYTVAVAGGVASGKTFLAKRLVNLLNQQVKATYVSLDSIGHYILSDSQDSLYRATRQRIADQFGSGVMHKDDTIDRRTLGRIVFSDHHALDALNNIMRDPMLARLYEETSQLNNGIVVIEGAIIVEANWTNLVNNNVILVNASIDIRRSRLMERSKIDGDEADNKISRQISPEERQHIMEARIQDHDWGQLWTINTDNGSEKGLTKLADEIIAKAKADIG